MIAANAAVLAERFPALLPWIEAGPEPAEVQVLRDGPAATLRIDGLQLASGYDPRAEAELQASLVPADAGEATVYGLGTGALPRHLLTRPHLRHLRVVAFHPGVLRVLCEQMDQSDWLADPRVELVRGDAPTELQPPFAAAPADLRLADDACARLRDLVFLELATPHLTRHVAAREAEILGRLEENRAFLEADGDAGELVSRWPAARGGTVWIAAAGPTLARHFGRLRARPAGEPLLALDAALAPLREAGLVPDAVFTMDSHRAHQLPFFDGDLAACAQTPLVYLPLVAGDILRRWPGPRRVMVSAHARYAELARRRPGALLWSSGSVLHPAVDLAVRCAPERVVLVGADFAHVGGRSHVEGSHHARDDAGPDIRAGAWVLNGHGERAPSLPNLVGYLRDLERYVAAHPGVSFVQADRDSARVEGAGFLDDAGDAGDPGDPGVGGGG